ncbi:hypothetical protein V2J09_017640 [Rumex salicifolius]
MEGDEMQHLLSMGFPADLAAQALAATGGSSVDSAADWILTHQHHHQHRPYAAANSSSPSQSQQPKLDRFFNFHLKPSSSSLTPKSDAPPDTSLPKRRKLSPPPPQSPPPQLSPPNQPLAERMRPRSIDEVIGQDHILGPTSPLRSSITCNRLPSMVLWGPPGTGKTSIARAIAVSMASQYRFVSLSAVTSGVKDVREAVDEARKHRRGKNGKKTVLFVDEVHRFNKSQQDSFLPVIEDGSIVFIGATTENPSFHLITPLLSRSRVLTVNPLGIDDISTLLTRAVGDLERGLSVTVSVGVKLDVEEGTIQLLSSQCDGDARVGLNALEVSAIIAEARAKNRAKNSGVALTVTVEDAKEAMQCKHLRYDRDREEHYNLISALHKCMRGNDANAALYWLARMLEGGEEPLYIARRLIRFASEDVGLADPSALVQAVACHQACHSIGMPECNVVLAQCVTYLALAPKSVAVYRAIGEAQSVVRKSVGGNEGVPLHLRNAPTKLMKDVGYGKGYIYTPDNPLASQTYLPPSLEGHKFLQWP